MSDKIDYLKGQTMPGVGNDGPFNTNLQVQVPQNMVNNPGLWQQLFLQLKDVYPVNLEEDLGKVLVVQPSLGVEGEENDCTQFLFNWIDVVNSIEAGDGIEVDSTDPKNPIVSVKLSEDPGNSIVIGNDGGVFSMSVEAGDSLESTIAAGVITFNVIVSEDAGNALRLGTDDDLFVPVITINGITQDTNGNITLGPEDIGEYGVVPFGPDGNIPVDPADIGDNGVPALDQNGKIPLDNIPEALIGAVNYQGTWEASTNTPALPTAAPENKGHYYVATDSGTWNGIDFTLGDWVISDGTQWGKVDALDGVISVNGKQGTVVINAADVGLGNVNNTSDANKPVSTAQATALAGKLSLTGGILTGPLISGAVNADFPTSGSNSIEVRNAGGSGDAGLAALSFHCIERYATKFVLRADGIMGMGGWTAPSWRWYVNLGDGSMVAAGNVTAYSDPRLKDNVVKIQTPLAIIKQLDGVRFTWNHKTSLIGSPGKEDIGVLADQVEAVLPEAVSESIEDEQNDGTRWKVVAYSKLIPVLIEAVKEQQTQIEVLQARVEELEAKQ